MTQIQCTLNGKKRKKLNMVAHICNTSSWEVKTGRPQPAWGPGYIVRVCLNIQKPNGKTFQWLNVIESDDLSSLEALWWKERTHSSVVLWPPHTCAYEHRHNLENLVSSLFLSKEKKQKKWKLFRLKITGFWPIALSSVIFSSENISAVWLLLLILNNCWKEK